MIHQFIRQEEGQALVLITLVMLVALTVGLAVSSQALIGSKQSMAEERSAQAYTAAESGAEVALQHLKTCTTDCITTGSGAVGDASYNYTITAASLLASNIYESKLEKDEVLQVDLSSVTSPNNDVRIYWWSSDTDRGSEADSPAGTCTTNPDAAIEFTYFAYDTGSTPQYLIRNKQAFDACTVRSPDNNFSDGTLGTYTFGSPPNQYDYSYYAKNLPNDFSFELNAADEQRILRIRSWYNNTWVAIALESGVSFPNQGYEITSVGTAGDYKRTLKVTKTNPFLPAIFDYVLFSGGDLQK